MGERRSVSSSSSSRGATAPREPWPPVLFASTSPYPESSLYIPEFPEKKCIQGFNGETLGKKTTWKSQAWEDNIKMHLPEAGWGMNWIDLAMDRDRWRAFVNAVMNLQVP